MGRQIVEIEVEEMKDAHVNFISLVKRGAMRVPFRILKSEDESMFNLTRLWTKKSEVVGTTPELIAVVLQKGSDIEGYTSALAEMGVTVKKHEVHEGTGSDVLIIKDDYDPEQSLTLKFSDNVGAVVSNVKKGFCSWGDSTDFMDNMKTSGYFPGMRMAMEALGDTIYACMYEAGEGEEGSPVAAVSKALDDFSTYVKQLTAEVPVVAFKMDDLEEIVTKACKAKASASAEEDDEVTKACKTKKDEEDAAAAAVVAKEEEVPAVVEKAMDFDTALDKPIIVTVEQLKSFLGDMNVTDAALTAFLTTGSAFNERPSTGVRSVQELISFLGASSATDAQITAFLSAGSQEFVKKEEVEVVAKAEGEEVVVAKEEEAAGEVVAKSEDDEGLIDTAVVQKAAKKETPAPNDQIKKDGEIDLNQFMAMTKQLSDFMGSFRETVAEVVSPMIGSVVAKMDEKIEGVNHTITGLQDSVKKAEEVAQKADEAVRGSVIGDTNPEQFHAVRTVAKKSDPNDGLFDTAFKFPGLE